MRASALCIIRKQEELIMKIGVSSYSFHQTVSAGRMSTYDIVDAAAKMGFEEIDFAVLLGDDPLEEMCKKLGKQAKDAGIGVSNYAVAADFLNKNLDEEVERVKGELRNAVLLGARTLRHDAAWKLPEDGSIRTFRQALPRIAEGCRRVTEYAETLGIRTMTENHGTFVQESARVEALIEAVDHPNFGALVDMGNFMCADEAPEKAVGVMAPLAFHVHAKDFLYKPCTARNPGKGWFGTRGGAFLRGTVIGHGVVPVEACLCILKNAGYDGTVAIEFEGMEPCEEAIALSRENLAALMQL